MSRSATRSKRKNKVDNARISIEKSFREGTDANGVVDENAKKCQSPEKVYSTAASEILGRYLVASCDIPAGEMIIHGEKPLVVGPVQQSDLLCLGCYAPLSWENFRCEKCNWPLCAPSCSGLYVQSGHDKAECDFLATILFDEELRRDKTNVYNCIVPLRCLLLKTRSESKWKILNEMESHNAARRKMADLWELNENTVVKKLRKSFDPLEIRTICGILETMLQTGALLQTGYFTLLLRLHSAAKQICCEVNCFEVSRTEISLRALFPEAALMSHNCVPNTIHTNDDELRLRVRASVSIPKGQPITISYAYTLQGTASRRAHIRKTKFFDCVCDRCCDPTELRTNLSTVTCPKCNRPTLLSTSPLDENPAWICQYKKCAKFTVSQLYVDSSIEKFESKLKSIPENCIRSYEKWMKEASTTFHRNHYLITGVKYTLSLLYGKVDGFMLQDLSHDLLQRKIIICEELLEIANIIQPGLSRLRGILLYELHAPIMMLLNHKRNTRHLSKKQLKHSLHRILTCLRESSDILQFESENTMEGKIGRAAKEALESAYLWEEELRNLP